MQSFYNFRVRRFDRYAQNALTRVNSHQTTPNLMNFLNLNFVHECDYIYSWARANRTTQARKPSVEA